MSNPNLISMTITAGTPEEFRKILLGLLGGVSVNVNQIHVSSDEPDKVVEKAVASHKAATANGAAKPDKPATAKPKAETKPAETKAAADPVPENATPEPAKEEPVKEAAPKPAAKKAAKEEPAPAPAGNAPELPENIKNTNSMRDLLTYLAEHGVDSADAMVATCTVLKKDVPILSKVPNVDERVRRALDVLALFPAPGEETAQA